MSEKELIQIERRLERLKEGMRARMRQERTYSTKEAAIEEAVETYRQTEELKSVWAAPADMGGGFTTVSLKNRESAFRLYYEEVVNPGVIVDRSWGMTPRL